MNASLIETSRPPLRQVIEDPSNYLATLLLNIQDGAVIPIIGPELLTVQHGDRTMLLYDYVAEQLAADPQVARYEMRPPFTLQQVVAVCARDKVNVYAKIMSILAQARFAPPAALLKLARIEKFRLFITTTFDSLLCQALNEARFGGQARTRELAYAPPDRRRLEDLEAGWDRGDDPIVFHLLGKAAARQEYVASEEDTLEFLFALQSQKDNVPERLFDELKSKNLLILGCSFPDWLARFFIRLAKRVPISNSRFGAYEVLADSYSNGERNLAVFLDSFSSSTRIFPGSAIEFVDRLYDEWVKQYGPPPEPVSPSLASLPETMPPGSIFISYASEDRPAAEKLYAGLRQVANVWFDRGGGLNIGSDYDLTIRRNIDSCSLFVPVISMKAIRRDEGYFRKEWGLAVRRRQTMAAERPFMVPVIVDDTAPNSWGVEEEFWKYHVAKLPEGNTTPEFLSEVKGQMDRLRDRDGRRE